MSEVNIIPSFSAAILAAILVFAGTVNDIVCASLDLSSYMLVDYNYMRLLLARICWRQKIRVPE